MTAPGGSGVRVGDRSDLGALTDLCRRALPEEAIGEDDLEPFLDPAPRTVRHPVDQHRSVALLVDAERGEPDGTGPLDIGQSGGRAQPGGSGRGLDAAAVMTLNSVFDEPRAHLQLLVVDPSQRRGGLGRVLVEAAEQTALSAGCGELTVGAGAPFYLFTGVDSRWTAALCLFEALGYERSAVEFDLVCPTRRPGRSAHDVEVLAVRDAAGADRLVAYAERVWPLWAAEFERAAQAGTAMIALDRSGGSVLGAAAHSVGRIGVIGPVAVDPSAQGLGVGTALMGAVCAELSAAGLSRAEIAWTSTIRFYARACDAAVLRASSVLRRDVRG